jgi:hypothetical protein
MVGSFFNRPLTRTGFLHFLAHGMQVVGCRDDRKKQNQRAGKRKGKVQRLRRPPLPQPEAERQRYQQKPAQIQQKFQCLFSALMEPQLLTTCFGNIAHNELTKLKTTLNPGDRQPQC